MPFIKKPVNAKKISQGKFTKMGIGVLVVLAAALFGCSAVKKNKADQADTDTLAQVRALTQKNTIYDDEFAARLYMSATFITPELADQLARQKMADFKTVSLTDPDIRKSEQKARDNYVFVVGLTGKDFKGVDLLPASERWRLNLILIDAHGHELMALPAQLVDHGINPRYLVDIFPHLSPWENVYYATFGPKNYAVSQKAVTARLQLSGPAGAVKLDFPAVNPYTK